MPYAGWVFTGSVMQSATGNPQDATYGANYIKSLVTTYFDATTVLENPSVEGGDDTVYHANERVVPPVGTPLVAVFSRLN